ncbi:MAG TPA: DUF3791 domain-containing protein [Clostridia bacterium]|jgi:hypothetical protein|nr:MAG: hypothetical protein BWX78_00753 [Firmicutes bacterium ADurb.Bin099]HNZ40904.1 DUF3791 domain-containing protein [Clostridia bacterium]HPY98153.1 DUF3791 domain-containing protein [Clostridia bacterium]HQC68094.1 DUF3791 domain-containing protein [Clostridia bacterium]
MIKQIESKELEFAIFCIENTAVHLGIKGSVLYKKLTEESDILYDYIIPLYDALHTQSKEYIVDDILRVMEKRGIAA